MYCCRARDSLIDPAKDSVVLLVRPEENVVMIFLGIYIVEMSSIFFINHKFNVNYKLCALN